MLAADISGMPYNKSAHRRALMPKLRNRSEGSVEFKHQNISAVLLGLGEPWIPGYKPASSFQLSLVDAVWRALTARSPWLEQASQVAGSSGVGVRDPTSLYVGPPPTLSNTEPPVNPDLLARVLQRYNVAEKDARNRELGTAGEEFVLDRERFQLRQLGLKDLSERVVWTAKEEGDGAGYDIASFESDGRPRLIEVKTTNGWDRTPFHISQNELRVADENRETWCLFRLHDFARSPKAFEIRPPLERHVSLTPTSFLAQLQ